MPRPNARLIIALTAVALLLGAGWFALRPALAPASAPVLSAPVGLFTSLPIVWNEAAELDQLLSSHAPPHWAKESIGERGAIVPLDLLTNLSPALTRLIMAQPRPLSPLENVALDAWVRGGGRLVLFADPALTEHSAFAVGDPRRPQDLVLLSPILARWGLELRFDEGQAAGLHTIDAGLATIPVDLPGHWGLIGSGACQLHGKGLVAECRIGKGRVLATADAALLDRQHGDAAHAAALAELLDRAFYAE